MRQNVGRECSQVKYRNNAARTQHIIDG